MQAVTTKPTNSHPRPEQPFKEQMLTYAKDVLYEKGSASGKGEEELPLFQQRKCHCAREVCGLILNSYAGFRFGPRATVRAARCDTP